MLWSAKLRFQKLMESSNSFSSKYQKMLCTVLILVDCRFSKIFVIQSAFFRWVEWSTQQVPQCNIYSCALSTIFPSSQCSSLVEHKTHNSKAQGSNQVSTFVSMNTYFIFPPSIDQYSQNVIWYDD